MAALTFLGSEWFSPPVRTGLGSSLRPRHRAGTVAVMPCPSIFCHVGYAGHMLNRVAVIVLDGRRLRARRALRGVRHRPHARRLPALRLRGLHAPRRPGPHRARASITADADLDRAGRAPTWSPCRRTDRTPRSARAVLAALRGAADRGARVLSLCSGAFVLGEAGLLDGRRCTTHWKLRRRAGRGASRSAGVDPDVLYVAGRHGPHQRRHRRRHRRLPAPGPPGARLRRSPTELARRMVVPPHRDGGQAPVHRGADARARPTRHARAAADLAGRPPRRADHRRRPGRPGPHGAAYLRPPVPGRDRHHPARLAHRPAGAAGPTAARGDRARRRGGRRPVRVRRRRRPAPPLRPPGRHHPAGLPHHLPRPRPPPADPRPVEVTPAGAVSSPAPHRRPGAPRRPPSRRPGHATAPGRTRRPRARRRR